MTKICLLSTHGIGATIWQPFTVARRDHQVKVDCIADFLCAALPLCIIWFVYYVPISVGEILMIILWPSVCLLLKIRSLFKDASGQKLNMRRLNSAREALSIERVCKAQKSKMPRIFTTGLTLYLFFFGCCKPILSIIESRQTAANSAEL